MLTFLLYFYTIIFYQKTTLKLDRLLLVLVIFTSEVPLKEVTVRSLKKRTGLIENVGLESPELVWSGLCGVHIQAAPAKQ